MEQTSVCLAPYHLFSRCRLVLLLPGSPLRALLKKMICVGRTPNMKTMNKIEVQENPTHHLRAVTIATPGVTLAVAAQ